MKFLKEHRQAIGITLLIVLLILFETTLYLNYHIKLDTFSGCLASLAAFLGVLLSTDSLASWGNKQKAIQEEINAQSKSKINDKRIKLAEDIIKACYEVEQSISRISNPFTYQDEIDRAQEVMKERTDISSKTKKPIQEGIVFSHRFEKEIKIFNNFMALKIQAKIYFGDSLAQLFDKVKENIHKKLYVNICMLLTGESSLAKEKEGFSMQIWDLSLEKNFMKDLIPEIEKILLPLIRIDN